MNHKLLFTIARYSILEAIRDKFMLFILAGVIIIFSVTLFIGELAITDSIEVQAAILSSFLRLFSVFTTSLFVITSMIREFNDKGFELILSHPMPRAFYYFGKMIGFSIVALLIVLMCFFCLCFFASYESVILWSSSLFCELIIIISLSLLCLFSFHSITISFSIVIAFYLLSRSIEAILLISNSPILAIGSVSHKFMKSVLDGIAYVMPDLYAFTKTDWLVYQDYETNTLLFVVVQTVIYVTLISFAALFDLYKKEL